VQTVQSFTHEGKTRAAFATVTEKSYLSAVTRIGTRSVMTMIVIFLVFAGIVGVLWVGARDVRAGVMTPGELVQFVIYAVMVAGAVGALSEVWGEVQRAAGATERLAELLSAEDTVNDPGRAKALARPVRGEIAFRGVTFRYPARPEVSALDAVDLVVAPGETVALVGPSGAGKTTVIQLIQRFYDPDMGRVTLDGVDLRDLARADFRQAIALVPQDPVIFAASARENIRFGRPDASDAEVEVAAKAAAAHEFLSGQLCGRAGRDAVGRAEAADRDCAGNSAGRAGAVAGRGDVGAGRGIGAGGAAGCGAAGGGTHDDHRGAPAGDSEEGGSDRGVRPWADRGAGQP
jgi:ATP-binding cassette, subfamily B, bacterial